MVTSKRCLRCEGIKSLLCFGKDQSKPDGYMIYCRDCQRKINKRNRSAPGFNEKRRPTRKQYKDRDRNWRLKTMYGITLEDFNLMFNLQNKVCKLCGSDKSDKNNFVVDHCHKTGKIRGILCSYCNRALGMFKDDPEILTKAIRYINGNF